MQRALCGISSFKKYAGFFYTVHVYNLPENDRPDPAGLRRRLPLAGQLRQPVGAFGPALVVLRPALRRVVPDPGHGHQHPGLGSLRRPTDGSRQLFSGFKTTAPAQLLKRG